MLQNTIVIQENYQNKIFEILLNYIHGVWNSQRMEFKDHLDMLFKLNVHYPQVYVIAKQLAPHDKTLQLAAAYHDWGRAIQFRNHGNFNDHAIGSDFDHHVIGYLDFLKIAPKVLDEKIPMPVIENSMQPGGMLHAVGMAILLHGLRGKAFEKEFALLECHPKAKNIVDTVSTIDDIANGTQCVGYLLREGQGRQKNVSRGGFIPDENEDLTTVSPRVMELFRRSETFNRNVECKTYPDYYVFGCFLATRALKNPQTREIAQRLLSEPISVWSYDDEKNLVSKRFENGIDAFNYLFKTTMVETDATEASKILQSYFNFGEYRQD